MLPKITSSANSKVMTGINVISFKIQYSFHYKEFLPLYCIFGITYALVKFMNVNKMEIHVSSELDIKMPKGEYGEKIGKEDRAIDF